MKVNIVDNAEIINEFEILSMSNLKPNLFKLYLNVNEDINDDNNNNNV